jgi:uncharacterized glyoxalase superfamily protein PhnB
MRGSLQENSTYTTRYEADDRRNFSNYFARIEHAASVQFYRSLRGLELLYGGERSSPSSLRADNSESVMLNLEHAHVVPRWGRIIFHVTDVDAFWNHLKGNGFDPEIPRDASWGERYFHVLDPDGHELSFARPLPIVR